MQVLFDTSINKNPFVTMESYEPYYIGTKYPCA